MKGPRIIRALASAVGLGLVAGSPASANGSEHLYGPAPAWDDYRRIAESSIVSTLYDPESARIQWMGGYVRGYFKPWLDRRVEGYYACGIINARNRLGGYVGLRAFVVVIDYGRVLYSEIDSSTNGNVTSQCVQAVKDRLFPALSTAAVRPTGAPPASGTAAPTSSGLTVRAMPDGAYISGVAPGSAAAMAGLKAGMVIGSVNGVPLAGMGDAMLRVIDAVGSDTTLTIIGSGTVKLAAKK